MASLKSLWLKFFRAVRARRQRRRPHWVEPSNAVTRAIYKGRPLVTMATWEEPAPAAGAPPLETPLTPAPREGAPAPKRPEVAA